MNKITLALVTYLLFAQTSVAQDFPSYGILSFDEIDLKECAFDKDANAVVLLHEARSDYDERHQLITTHHVRIKILKEKGMGVANVTIPFYRKDDFEYIDQVEGMTLNTTSGNQTVTTNLDRKSIFTQKMNERIGQVVFAFPAIRPGSIIEYKYRSTMKHYGGLEDWSFQEELPVVASRYTLIILPNSEFAYRVNKSPDLPITIKKDPSTGGVFFEMNNIPALGDEPYMDARGDYLQKAIFQLSSYGGGNMDKKNYMTSWDELTRELINTPEFGAQLNKSIPGTTDFIEKIKTLSSPEAKMNEVFDYVRSNMTWNDLSSLYSNEGVKNAWQKKVGNRGDINLLLINLLKEAGLDAYPILVSERFHGKVESAYPFLDQFNAVFACVVIRQKKYYLDASNRSMPAHITPPNILNTKAFIVHRKAGGLVDITNDTLEYREFILANLVLDEKGSISGDVNVKSYDYARFKKLDAYKADETRFLSTYFEINETSIAGKKLEVKNIENDSLPLEQSCDVSGHLNSTGDYFYVPLNVFCGFDHNPFLSDHRFSNINFGYRRTILLNANFRLPASYTIDELPRSIKLVNVDKDIVFIRQMELDKNTNSLRCIMQFEFKKSLYASDEYDTVKEMYQKMFGYLKEPLVLKKKG